MAERENEQCTFETFEIAESRAQSSQRRIRCFDAQVDAQSNSFNRQEYSS